MEIINYRDGFYSNLLEVPFKRETYRQSINHFRIAVGIEQCAKDYVSTLAERIKCLVIAVLLFVPIFNAISVAILKKAEIKTPSKKCFEQVVYPSVLNSQENNPVSETAEPVIRPFDPTPQNPENPRETSMSFSNPSGSILSELFLIEQTSSAPQTDGQQILPTLQTAEPVILPFDPTPQNLASPRNTSMSPLDFSLEISPSPTSTEINRPLTPIFENVAFSNSGNSTPNSSGPLVTALLDETSSTQPSDSPTPRILEFAEKLGSNRTVKTVVQVTTGTNVDTVSAVGASFVLAGQALKRGKPFNTLGHLALATMHLANGFLKIVTPPDVKATGKLTKVS